MMEMKEAFDLAEEIKLMREIFSNQSDSFLIKVEKIIVSRYERVSALGKLGDTVSVPAELVECAQ